MFTQQIKDFVEILAHWRLPFFSLSSSRLSKVNLRRKMQQRHPQGLSRMLFEGTQNSSSVLKKMMIQGIPYTWDTAIYIYL